MFSWGKNKKNQPPGAPGSGGPVGAPPLAAGGPLPPATRDISSSHGPSPENRAPSANGNPGPGQRDGMERRPTLGNTQASNGPITQAVQPLRQEDIAPPRIGRDRADSDLMAAQSRQAAGPVRLPQADSPYPWSQRRLNFTANLSPFPRYGAAVNGTASRWIYIMGGLVNSQTVKGDLWMIDLTNGAMTCYALNTVAEGPGPRVGHASLLVGNAFIVFGGDTKLEDGDVLDDTLYLLNTSSKQWARASPSGSRPAGRYGHTLNILGSKIYIYGGQVEGYFFNDLVAFDLNTLQVAGNRWEILIQNNHDNRSIPAPRTNHSVISWQDKLYLFGGTDGTRWFNDVWTYDPSTNAWTEQDCIGYIPAAREGHAAALINDTMYIFGGRIQDGTDLGDLVAFKISTRRWYMFQNMGMSPSPRSGHSMTAYGNHIIVLAGEPSSAPRDPAELSLAYVLDTTKIRYPASDPSQQQQAIQQAPQNQQIQAQPNAIRKYSTDRERSGSQPSAIPIQAQKPQSRSESPQQNGIRPPQLQAGRATGSSTPTQQPPLQNKPQEPTTLRSTTPSRSGQNPQYEQQPVSPVRDVHQNIAPVNGTYQSSPQSGPHSKAASTNPSRTGSRLARQQPSIDSDGRDTPRASVDTPATQYSRDVENQVDSGAASSPALSQQTEELVKELEAAKTRNAWYASELALARKSGYQPNSSGNPILDQQAADVFGDDDKPLIEALLKMKNELTRVQGSIDAQSGATAARIAEIEKQRDTAISEAVYAKAKLAAHGGSTSQNGTPQPDALRGSVSPDLDRANEMSRRLAVALNTQKELNAKLETLNAAIESERRARALAEDTADAAESRLSELDMYKQVSSGELESLRAELHEAQRIAREETANAAEAHAARSLLEADKSELTNKHSLILEDRRSHTTILQTLRDAVTASTEKAEHIEQKLEEERQSRLAVEQKFAQYRVEHESKANDYESLSRRLVDAETLAAKHAQEARTHREAVLSGLGAVTSRSIDEPKVSDERIEIMSQQLESANNMARQNKDAADSAAEKLRRAEERIAGLEAYQEQTNRENLAIRKQAQLAMKELQVLHNDKNEMSSRLERSMLDSNAYEVQLKTLKHLLEERGINPSDVRRSRVLDSPGSRYGTPDMNRIGELQRQLDDSVKSHDELRSAFEDREQQLQREWENKLSALSEEHNGTIKYVRGLEKIFNKMKPEVQRYKVTIQELEKELATAKASAGSRDLEGGDGAKEWETERERLKKEMFEMQESVKTSMTALDSQIVTLKRSLADTEADRQRLLDTNRESEIQMRKIYETASIEMEHLRRDNKILESRAADAEHKVQMFLDQFEHSVDNYRRMSRLEQQNMRGAVGLGNKGGADSDSLYSTTTADEYDAAAEDTETEGPGISSASSTTAAAASKLKTPEKKARDRNSTALDTLTNELESLRSKWETSRGNYKMNDRFDFEKSSGAVPSLSMQPGAPGSNATANSLLTWSKGLDTDTESIASQESAEKLLMGTPGKGSIDLSRPAPKSVPAGMK